MSYQFSLQKLLDLKEKEKEQLQSALSTSLKNLEDEKLIHSSLIQRQNEISQRLIETQQNSTNAAYLMGLHSFQQRLQKNIHLSKQRVTKAEKDVDRKMQQVLEKSKEEKTYQILKEKERARFLYAENRAEQNVLDEISTNLYLRGSETTIK